MNCKDFFVSKLVIIGCLLLSLVASSLLIYIATQHNPQGEYCKIVGNNTGNIKPESYVRDGLLNFRPYDPSKDTGLQAYNQTEGENINEANFFSSQRPCVLQAQAYKVFGVFLSVFFISLLALSSLVKFLYLMLSKAGSK